MLKFGLGAAALSSLSKLQARTSNPPGAEAPADSTVRGPLITKPIPSTGEHLPVIGLGTGHSYGGESSPVAPGGAVPADAKMTPERRAEIKELLRIYPTLGGKVIDTAAIYVSEPIIGDITRELGNRDKLFLATKVIAAYGNLPAGKETGLAIIERSFKRLHTDKIDLIAVHGLRDPENQLANLRDLKQSGRIRYIGITADLNSQHAPMEEIMRAHPLDFIQVNYAIDDRESAGRILPLAQDRGMGVMINVPFGKQRLWNKSRSKPLPDWASEFDCRSWGQFFLKYVVSHPGVTCAIPGVGNLRHLEDDMGAAYGRLPDAAMRTRMEKYMDAI